MRKRRIREKRGLQKISLKTTDRKDCWGRRLALQRPACRGSVCINLSCRHDDEAAEKEMDLAGDEKRGDLMGFALAEHSAKFDCITLEHCDMPKQPCRVLPFATLRLLECLSGSSECPPHQLRSLEVSPSRYFMLWHPCPDLHCF